MRVPFRSAHPGLGRLLAVLLVLVGEYQILAVRFDGGVLASMSGPWAVLANISLVVSLMVCIATSGLLVTRGIVRQLSDATDALERYDLRWGAVHVAAYVAFSLCTSRVFAAGPAARTAVGTWFFAWLATGIATVISLLACAAPASIGRIARLTVRVAAAGFVLGIAAWFVALRASDLWPRLAGVTLRCVAAVLALVSRDVTVDESRRLVGADGFDVEVNTLCSGIEGMALILVFVAVYLFRFRKRFRFPRVLLLLPVAVFVAFAMNVVRIAALVLVGAHLSPQIAFGGFHSRAGWILVSALALGLVAIVERTALFSRDADIPLERPEQDLTSAYLLPELTLLAVSLATGLFTAGVDFLYPVRVICAAGVLVAVGKHLRSSISAPSLKSVLLGVAVFALWLPLSPHGPSPLAAQLRDGLASFAPVSRWAFVVTRIAGGVIVVPIAEELAFRGYLQRRLVSADFADVSFRTVTALSVACTALCFGFLHQAVVAGVLASLAYSGAAYLRGRLVDAVAAHATTNLLIAVWVLALGRWDLWS